ncbi:acid phosphatase [Afifella pfennigii]|uniref:acid phosphatase n=1 Tax=Afifella pfennigii TaxID=209897 RepID=UPI0005589E03|nr:phosphatase PAP2 family protein [Afifella pfennigii]
MREPCLSLALTVALAVAVAGVAVAEERTVTVSGQNIVEIAPGILQGYLAENELLDSAAFVPPAPAADSGRQVLDTAWAVSMRALRDTPRWDMAIRDADLSFPAAVDAFSCALGFEITEADTPTLYLLLWRSLADIGLSSYSAKNAYQRERPFMVGDTPICTPEDEEALRTDGSYPSGHTAIGWGWALILAQLAPDRTEALLDRGRAFGESRTVCNVHWYSDVVAGRLVGAAAVARLQADAEFLVAMQAAAAEIAELDAEARTTDNDCPLEAATLAAMP